MGSFGCRVRLSLHIQQTQVLEDLSNLAMIIGPKSLGERTEMAALGDKGFGYGSSRDDNKKWENGWMLVTEYVSVRIRENEVESATNYEG
ncbi:hypothetical protein ACFL9U_17460 [Thermodesulfobacteriota bacterium]